MVSTLRRLTADHAILHSTELPPCYLFPLSSADSSVDDLTQLNVLITGPTGTPYSQGLWKLSLKIPESYPKAPPKATFGTRIWHPNVEETTGSVCVDTLKKDWQPNLTLRDVLITIYCLLIQPNPDSALNATAGHLLQDDYDSFAHQARLMTSIHARIPSDLKDLALSARRRGEIGGTAMGQDIEQRPKMESQSTSLLPVSPMGELPDCVTHTQSALVNVDQAPKGESLAKEDEYATSAPKEIDPLQSSCPVLTSSPQRPATAKRPLSDLHIAKPEHDMIVVPCLSPSERNAVNNVLPLASIAAPDRSRKGLQIAGKSQTVNRTGRGQETEDYGTGSDDIEENPTKRICSDSGKENAIETSGARKPFETPLPAVSAATKLGVPISRKASASAILATNRMKGKSRVGLRRL